MEPVKAVTSPAIKTNPLKDIRLANWLTLDKVAYDLDTSRQFIIRCEQAVYTQPPERLLKYLLNHLEETGNPESLRDRAVGLGMDDELVVYHLYREFQSYVRKRNHGRLLEDFDWSYRVGALNAHPFVNWRWASGLSARIGVSKMFCVHPALISKFELTPNLCTTPPGELLAALEESGYSKELLASFCEAYDTYKADLSEKFRSKQ